MKGSKIGTKLQLLHVINWLVVKYEDGKRVQCYLDRFNFIRLQILAKIDVATFAYEGAMKLSE
jgi:hypothetical protein